MLAAPTTCERRDRAARQHRDTEIRRCATRRLRVVAALPGRFRGPRRHEQRRPATPRGPLRRPARVSRYRRGKTARAPPVETARSEWPFVLIVDPATRLMFLGFDGRLGRFDCAGKDGGEVGRGARGPPRARVLRRAHDQPGITPYSSFSPTRFFADRAGFRRLCRWKTRAKQRAPKVSAATVNLIQRMARENRFWGGRTHPRRAPQARHPCQQVSHSEVHALRPPTAAVRANGRPSLRNHADDIWACDFLQIYDALLPSDPRLHDHRARLASPSPRLGARLPLPGLPTSFARRRLGPRGRASSSETTTTSLMPNSTASPTTLARASSAALPGSPCECDL